MFLCVQNYVRTNSWESYVTSGRGTIEFFDGHGCSGEAHLLFTLLCGYTWNLACPQSLLPSNITIF